ncbi:15390_t:CDS:2, partial [Racocetra fulgida]
MLNPVFVVTKFFYLTIKDSLESLPPIANTFELPNLYEVTTTDLEINSEKDPELDIINTKEPESGAINTKESESRAINMKEPFN